MPIAKYSSLQNLIVGLSKAEKRHFILYVNRLESNKGGLFVKLFQLIDKYPNHSEVQIYKKELGITRTQFVNTKRHLYSQLLKSLRLLHERADAGMNARRLLDYATILYIKGHYQESLSILNSINNSNELDNIIYLEVSEFQKKIESRHITRSRRTKNKIEDIIALSSSKQALIAIEIKMSNLSLEIQGLYIRWGFAKNDRDALMYQGYFRGQIPNYKTVRDSTKAITLWHQAHVWYHYMRLDFHYSYKHAALWVTKMIEASGEVERDPDLIMRGYHYILTNCFYLRRQDKFEYWLARYKHFRKTYHSSFNETSVLLDFIYHENAELNSRIISKRYTRLDNHIQELELRMKSWSAKLDVHRILTFQYKFALIYSYKGDNGRAIEFLNRVIDAQEQQLRSDIFCYARLVHLMCHYRLNNFALVLNLLQNVKNAFDANEHSNMVVDAMIAFLRKGSRAMNFGISELIETSLERIIQGRSDNYAKVAFIYYNFETWLRKDIS